MNKQVYKKPFGTYSKFKTASDKEAKIGAFMARKESSIKAFNDAKTEAMSIMQAFNASTERASNWELSGKLESKDYWVKQEEFYQEHLTRLHAKLYPPPDPEVVLAEANEKVGLLIPEVEVPVDRNTEF